MLIDICLFMTLLLDVHSTFSTLHSSVSALSPGSYLRQGLLDNLSCCPLSHLGSNRKPVEAETVTQQADMSEGGEVLLCWGLTHKQREKILEDVQKANPSSADCLKSTLVSQDI